VAADAPVRFEAEGGALHVINLHAEAKVESVGGELLGVSEALPPTVDLVEPVLLLPRETRRKQLRATRRREVKSASFGEPPLLAEWLPQDVAAARFVEG
jgi:hypothetical protein